MSKRVMVPVDRSEGSVRALSEARIWAGEDAEIWAVSVVEERRELDDDETGAAVAEVSDFVEGAGMKVDRIEVRPTLGNVAIVIARLAEDAKADLIVVASHGRKGLARLHMGSVAERVVRYATCPVLVVKNGPSGG